MGCRIFRNRQGRIALRLQWRVRGHSLRSQESLGVTDNPKNRATVARDFVAPIQAEMRARRFTMERYLEWFPTGSKAALFRRELGLAVASVAAHQNDPNDVTLREWYKTWIERHRNPDHTRPAQYRDYKQHMTSYILGSLGNHRLSEIGVPQLNLLIEALKQRRSQRTKLSLSKKTVRNVVDSTLRACMRDAAKEGLPASREVFDKIDWPRRAKNKPDPFDYVERDEIIGYFAGKRYHGFMAMLLLSGPRPSEVVALDVRDFDPDPERETISVRVSRYLGHASPPKTAGSERTFRLHPHAAAILRRELAARGNVAPDAPLFLNERGERINQSDWPKTHWRRCLDALGIRYRRWYSTRETFISLTLSEGAAPLGVAEYCGNSLQVIESSYAKYKPRDPRGVVGHVRGIGEVGAKTQPPRARAAVSGKNRRWGKASPTGFENDGGRRRSRLVPHRMSRKFNSFRRSGGYAAQLH